MLGKHSLPHEKASYSFKERAAVLRRAVSRAVGSFPGSSLRLNWVGLTRVYRSRSTRLRPRVCKRDYAQSASRHSLSRRMAAPGPSTTLRHVSTAKSEFVPAKGVGSILNIDVGGTTVVYAGPIANWSDRIIVPRFRLDPTTCAAAQRCELFLPVLEDRPRR